MGEEKYCTPYLINLIEEILSKDYQSLKGMLLIS